MRMRKKRGATLVELLVSSGISLLVLGAALATLYSGMRSWIMGASMINAEVDGSQAVRRLVSDLREAMAVTVAADGRSVSFRMPQRDANGDFIVPPLWDGVSRRAILTETTGGKFTLAVGVTGSEIPVSRNVILIDPESGTGTAYRVFSPGPGTVTREIHLMVVTRTNGPRNEPIYHRIRETLFLRNIPSITQ